jgi:hypothetical protein
MPFKRLFTVVVENRVQLRGEEALSIEAWCPAAEEEYSRQKVKAVILVML